MRERERERWHAFLVIRLSTVTQSVLILGPCHLHGGGGGGEEEGLLFIKAGSFFWWRGGGGRGFVFVFVFLRLKPKEACSSSLSPGYSAS